MFLLKELRSMPQEALVDTLSSLLCEPTFISRLLFVLTISPEKLDRSKSGGRAMDFSENKSNTTLL